MDASLNNQREAIVTEEAQHAHMCETWSWSENTWCQVY